MNGNRTENPMGLATTVPRLEQLFQRCSPPITIAGPGPDGQEVEITVVLWKLTPTEEDTAERYASAARARANAGRNNPDSIEYLEALDIVLQRHGDDRVALVKEVAAGELAQEYESIRARVSAEDQWSKDDYLRGLIDSFTEDVVTMAAAAEAGVEGFDEHDEKVAEAIRIANELGRWRDQVNGEFETVLENAVDGYSHVPMEDLRDRAARELLSQIGQQAFYEERARCKVWLGTRHYQVIPGSQTPERPDGIVDFNAPRYFETREQVDELAIPVRLRLGTALQDLEVGSLEGNGLPAPAGSSTWSESPNGSETPASSSPTAATA